MKKIIQSISIILMIMSGAFVTDAMEKQESLEAAIAASSAKMPSPDGKSKKDEEHSDRQQAVYKLEPEGIIPQREPGEGLKRLLLPEVYEGPKDEKMNLRDRVF
ncbi:MAG: hypothetical protein K0R76_320 [Alphaproteobacteria bacterium]|nr:hypothetical protein [Alphaproteobacteria bacterium]